MKHSLLICLAAVVLAAGCGQRSGRNTAPSEPMRDFPTVKVPDIYTGNSDRQVYFAEHFWDRFLSEGVGMVSDSVTVCGVSAPALEQAFMAYVMLIQSISHDAACKDVDALFDRVTARQQAEPSCNVFDIFRRLMERYLYDPNSPYRNEDLYRPYVEKLSKSPLIDPEMAPAYANDARMCALNAVGTQAADFRFTDAAGRTRSLYDIKAANILLFFSNPGCTACQEIVENIKAMDNISKKISSGRLAVVNIYIDEDLKAWREHLSEFPKDWINGYDAGHVIRRDLLYNVRGIPSLYILNKDKRVVLKDAPEDRVFAYLDTIRSE